MKGEITGEKANAHSEFLRAVQFTVRECIAFEEEADLRGRFGVGQNARRRLDREGWGLGSLYHRRSGSSHPQRAACYHVR